MIEERVVGFMLQNSPTLGPVKADVSGTTEYYISHFNVSFTTEDNLVI
jgi:hypothetical protein